MFLKTYFTPHSPVLIRSIPNPVHLPTSGLLWPRWRSLSDLSLPLARATRTRICSSSVQFTGIWGSWSEAAGEHSGLERDSSRAGAGAAPRELSRHEPSRALSTGIAGNVSIHRYKAESQVELSFQLERRESNVCAGNCWNLKVSLDTLVLEIFSPSAAMSLQSTGSWLRPSSKLGEETQSHHRRSSAVNFFIHIYFMLFYFKTYSTLFFFFFYS